MFGQGKNKWAYLFMVLRFGVLLVKMLKDVKLFIHLNQMVKLFYLVNKVKFLFFVVKLQCPCSFFLFKFILNAFHRLKMHYRIHWGEKPYKMDKYNLTHVTFNRVILNLFLSLCFFLSCFKKRIKNSLGENIDGCKSISSMKST